jgi:hypothetical protein
MRSGLAAAVTRWPNQSPAWLGCGLERNADAQLREACALRLDAGGEIYHRPQQRLDLGRDEHPGIGDRLFAAIPGSYVIGPRLVRGALIFSDMTRVSAHQKARPFRAGSGSSRERASLLVHDQGRREATREG